LVSTFSSQAQAGIAGDVLLEFVVDENGNVPIASAVKSSRREFEAPAVEALRQWKFDSGRVRGRVVNTRMQVHVTFVPTEASGVFAGLTLYEPAAKDAASAASTPQP
jgi:TonB family protein